MPNRLADETSPYLLQHQDNPVDWYPWGPEALERARVEDSPILLSIGYSAGPGGAVAADGEHGRGRLAKVLLEQSFKNRLNFHRDDRV